MLVSRAPTMLCGSRCGLNRRRSLTLGNVERHLVPLTTASAPDPVGFLDRDGFFDLSAPLTYFSGPDMLNAQPNMALLSPGGAGKTTLLKDLCAQERGTWIDLAALEQGELRPALVNAIAAERPAYLDSLDEAARGHPNLIRILEQELGPDAARAVSWRIGCRPESWTRRLAKSIGVREYRLLPLTRQAARQLVEDIGVDATFLDDLVRAGLGRLSASPQRLIDAARQWHATGRLPATRAESLDYEIDRLLSETDEYRGTPAVPADQRRRIAGRLAAFTLFTQVRRFSFHQPSSSSIPAIDELPSQADPEAGSVAVAPAQYRDVLATALFDQVSSSVMAFRHQLYAEQLAAEYVCQRPLVRSQVADLLGLVDGVVPGTMIAVAARILARRPDFADLLVPDNAAALLEADVDLPETVRKAIVSALLDAAGAGDAEPNWRLDLGAAVHSGLEAQLRERIDAGLTDPQQVWWIGQLAATGGCSGLNSDMLQLAFDPRWPDFARRAAATAIAANGDGADRDTLRRLLDLNADEDPDDELLATALDCLYPESLTTAEFLTALRPRRNRHFTGAYRVLQADFGGRIPDADLPAALQWAVATRSPAVEANTDFADFIAVLVQRAWAERRDPTIYAALAELLAVIGSEPAVLRPHGAAVPWSGERDDRLRLAVTLAERFGSSGWVRFRWAELLSTGLIAEGDEDWLLGELPQQPAGSREALGRCLAALIRPGAPESHDVLDRIPPDHPAFAYITPQVGPYADDDTVSGAPDHHARSASWLRKALAEAEIDITTWWRVAASSVLGGVTSDALFDCDLTVLQGWSLLEPGKQQQILSLGLRYVREHVPTPAEWAFAASVSTEQVLPDCAGVYLLTTLAGHQRGLLDGLPLEVWKAWVPTIVAAPAHGSRDLVEQLVELAPASIRPDVRTALLDHLDHVDLLDPARPLSPLYEHMAAELMPVIAERLLAARYPSAVGHVLLNLLVSTTSYPWAHSPELKWRRELALTVCRTLTANSDSPLQAEAQIHLSKLDPEPALRRLLAAQPSDEDVATAVAGIDAEALSPGLLTELGGLLVDRFPFDDDPAGAPVGQFSSHPAHSARYLRNRIIDRMARLGLAKQLRLLAVDSRGASRVWLRYQLRRARQQAADMAVRRARQQAADMADVSAVRPSMPGLLHLLGRSDVRVVRDGADALNVLTDHLTAIQHTITGKGAFREIWHKDEPQSEDDISDWLQRRLDEQLRAGIVDREVGVQRIKDKGIGTRIDLRMAILNRHDPTSPIRVTIEAKLVNNRELPTAMQQQLVGRYLFPTQQRCGILLVYWVAPDQRPVSWRKAYPSRTELEAELQRQAQALAPDYDIRPIVLDISRPAV